MLKWNRIVRIKREMDGLTAFQLLFSTLAFSIFLVAPVAFMTARALFYEGSPSLKYFQDVLSSREFVRFPPEGELLKLEDMRRFNPQTGTLEVIGKCLYVGTEGPDFGIIINSLLVAFVVSFFAAVMGTIAAFVMARYDFPGKSIFRIMLLIPTLATPFVNAYVVGKVFGLNGLFNYFFYDLLHILPFKLTIGGLAGIAFIQTLSYYPIIYLNVFSSLINIDPSLEEQAENLGAHGFDLFRTVTLPLSLPGLAAGSTITFIFSIEDLGAPIALKGAFGDDLAGKVMSFAIYDEFRKGIGSIDQVHASTFALAVIMLIIATVSFFAIKKYVGLRAYAMLSKGGRWNPRLSTPKKLRKTLTYFFLTLLVAIAIFPQVGVTMLAFTDWALSGPIPKELTLKYMINLVINPEISRAIMNSLTYAGVATLIIAILGTSVAYLVARRSIPGRDALDMLATMPIAIPGIIVAVGYLLFFAVTFSGSPMDPFINPGLLLIFAYSIRRLPFTVRSVFAGLQQTHVELEEASYNLGADRKTTLLKIVIPLIAGNIIGGGILSFVYSMSEVSVSITLSSLNPTQGPITHYMSQLIYGIVSVEAVSTAAALGVLLMSAQVIAIIVSNYILKQRVAFLGM